MKSIEIINEWNTMAAEQQENYCKACVCTALHGRYHLSTGYTFEDATQDTYLRVLEAMQDPEALDGDEIDTLYLLAATNDTEKAAIRIIPTFAHAVDNLRCLYNIDIWSIPRIGGNI